MSDNASNGTPVERGEGPAAGAQAEDDKGTEAVEPTEAHEAGAPAADEPAAPKTPLDEALERADALEADKARLEEEKQDVWNRLLRATADLDNYRKRSRRELDDARIEARTRVLKEMLPVIDNLERAVEHAQKTSQKTSQATSGAGESGIIEGVQLVLRQFIQALERCEVVQVEAEGKPFDPNVHEAISQMETAEHPPGSVAQVLQRGYLIGERLLRPALVVVAKAPPAADGAAAAPADAPADGAPVDDPGPQEA